MHGVVQSPTQASTQLSVHSHAQPSQCVVQASSIAGARSKSTQPAIARAKRSAMAHSASTRRMRSHRVSPPTFRRRLVAYIFTVRGEIAIAQPISR